MKNQRGRWNKTVSEREQKWEDALALIMHRNDITVLLEDCGELYLRLAQVRHRHPERASLVEPGMERARIMRSKLLRLRDELNRAREILLEWRKENDSGS